MTELQPIPRIDSSKRQPCGILETEIQKHTVSNTPLGLWTRTVAKMCKFAQRERADRSKYAWKWHDCGSATCKSSVQYDPYPRPKQPKAPEPPAEPTMVWNGFVLPLTCAPDTKVYKRPGSAKR
ncbi:hypothetical protein MGYG_02424 [Nannizzia gypsea CBS 118893]|uniref:Uncharacterized protein n=1 Tax=Arthroderma gypseum (strain ATCC MYA-4604 / CBS 118893) TaxID=535722 RepID=E4URJ1_ARTGP|nr:hypothetical protein MGYG_02424 [Nannizzia gypsea CBS 118893]EFQ99413.1 hypothetical protein MGYG_02424 [Nannizzia gypsea CBS 118893]